MSKMARIPDQLIEEIKSKANIVDILSEYVQLKKSGQNYFTHCPFHEDKTPSFSVNEEKQIFHCFSCGRGGSVFNFLMEVEGLTYPEAVFKVADIAGIPIDKFMKHSVLNQSHPASDPKSEFLYEVHEKTTEFYHHMLMNSQMGHAAYQYLINRGMTDDLLKEFRIGYAPQKRDTLYHYLKSIDELDSNVKNLQESGIFSKPKVDEPNELLDRFFNRIIFPITDVRGRVVAFSGRVFEETTTSNFKTAKYLNSPETYIFNKRKVLFNYDKAKATIKQQGEVFLFEGFMDVISAWQAGLKNGVASMGTSFTEEHIQFLRQKANKLIISYDGDKAGMEATKRLTDTIRSFDNTQVEIIIYPNQLDPDDYIKQYGPTSFMELMDKGRKTYLSFLMEYHLRDRNLDNEAEKIDYVNQLVPEIANIQSAPEREIYTRELSKEVNLSFESLLDQVQLELTKENFHRSKQLKQASPNRPEYGPIQRAKVEKLSKVEHAERNLLNRLFNFENTLMMIYNQDTHFSFAHENYQQLFILYESHLNQNNGEFHLDTFQHRITNADQQGLIEKIKRIDLKAKPSQEEISDYVHLISKQSPLLNQLKDKKRELEKAKKDGNTKAQLSLSTEITNLIKQIKN